MGHADPEGRAYPTRPIAGASRVVFDRGRILMVRCAIELDLGLRSIPSVVAKLGEGAGGGGGPRGPRGDRARGEDWTADLGSRGHPPGR